MAPAAFVSGWDGFGNRSDSGSLSRRPGSLSVRLGRVSGLSPLFRSPVLTSDPFVPGALFPAVWGLVTSVANTHPTEAHLAAHWLLGGRKRVPLMAPPFPGDH